MRRLRPSRSQLVLLSASTVLCASLLLSAEWLVRVRQPTRLRLSPVRSAIVHSKLYGWQLRANWSQHDEQGRQVSTDAARRRVLALSSPSPRAPRLALLGDSVTFGSGVGDDQTFASLLAAREGWTIANFAVPGWGTDQSLLRYEHEARAWRPSVVVLNVCLANDLADNMLETYLYDPSWPKPYFTISRGRLRYHQGHLLSSRTRRAWRWLWENSHLLNLLAAPPREHSADAHWMGRRRAAVKDEAAAARLTVMQVRQLQEAAAADGSVVVVALHPDKPAFERRSTLASRLAAELAAAGLPTLDLGARYRETGWAFADLMLDGLGHLSPRGHVVAAEAIRDAVLSRTMDARSGALAQVSYNRWRDPRPRRRPAPPERG